MKKNMKIWVDADACSVIKEILYRFAVTRDQRPLAVECLSSLAKAVVYIASSAGCSNAIKGVFMSDHRRVHA